MRRRVVALFMLLVGIGVAGCSSTPPGTPPERCNNVECNHLSLSLSKCDTNYLESESRRIDADDKMEELEGVISVRHGAGRCASIYWATFTPDRGNGRYFKVTFMMSARPETVSFLPAAPTQQVSTPRAYRELQVIDGCVTLLDGGGNKVGTNACIKR